MITIDDVKEFTLKTFIEPDGKLTPIELDRDSVNLNDYDYAFLGAWNFKEVIANKESDFVQNGGQFITHVPKIMMFS